MHGTASGGPETDPTGDADPHAGFRRPDGAEPAVGAAGAVHPVEPDGAAIPVEPDDAAIPVEPDDADTSVGADGALHPVDADGQVPPVDPDGGPLPPRGGTPPPERRLADTVQFRRLPTEREATRELLDTLLDDVGSPPDETDRPGQRAVGLVLAALVLLGVAAAGAAYATLRDGVEGASATTSPSAPVGSPAAPAPVEPPEVTEPVDPPDAAPSAAPPAHSVAAPLDGRRKATLELLSGATTVVVRTARSGADLYRVVTPEGGSVLPLAEVAGDTVRVRLEPGTGDGPGQVEIILNAAVRWGVRLAGGAVEHRVDLRAGQISQVELAGGATRIDLRLPAPRGSLPIRLTGGAKTVRVTAPDGPARVRLGSGAAAVVLDDRTHRGIAPGTTFTPQTWGHAADRFDVDAAAGVGTLTVTGRDETRRTRG